MSLLTTTISADDVTQRDPFVARLAAPMDSFVKGKPFREAILDIARQAKINVWVDRLVDPTTPVQVGSVGPTVYTAVSRLGEERDCVVMPVANILLVGRPTWVDQSAASLLSLKLKLDNKNAVADVRWDDLTTPIEAFQIASAATEVDLTPTLPHDLWPATSWTQIDRRAAITLVLAQFDRRPQSAVSLNKMRTDKASAAGKFERRYELDKSCLPALRATFSRVDRRGRIEPQAGFLVANGSVTAHRSALDEAFKKLAENVKPVAPASANFEVNLEAIAADALQQLAAKLGKQCEIAEDARDACQQVVTAKGVFSLRSLIEHIAKEAKVTVTWLDQKLVIKK